MRKDEQMAQLRQELAALTMPAASDSAAPPAAPPADADRWDNIAVGNESALTGRMVDGRMRDWLLS